MRETNPRFNQATLIGLSAVLMWSVKVGLFRSVAEIFGPIAGAAMIFSVAGLFANMIIGAPKLQTFPRLYLSACSCSTRSCWRFLSVLRLTEGRHLNWGSFA